ncbi:putative RNA-directed DNA polymerase [Tanacetum coccineum]|uniref:RNA-directed DNA polymerase n=1 Tax=Tanacetum coccineum TaxID=301880 RepID=A0ABQ5CYF1_9ASTR
MVVIKANIGSDVSSIHQPWLILLGAGDEDAALYDDENISEGEGLDLYNLDLLFQNDRNNRTDEGQSIRSVENFSFAIRLNKTVEPKSYKESVQDSKQGIDYEETFSPVVKMVTVRCVLSLAVQSNWSIYQLDINNAFLYGDLEEEVYMTLPEGYFSPNDKRNDLSLYTKSVGESFVVLLMYVDDILITGNDLIEIEKCKDLLNSKFLIKDLGELNYFLRIEVIKNDCGICLSQRKYNLELLSEFGMLACKPSKIPLYVSKNKNKPVKLVDYEKLLDNLSQDMHAPKLIDMKNAFKVLRYIKHSPGKGIQYSKSNDFQVSAYVDSDWAKCIATRKSITGYAVYLGNCLVSWKSKRQTVLAKSSAEAEFRAMSSVACEIIWILKILTELNVKYKTPVDMFCDNNAAMQIATNPVFHERTKHFEIDLFFLREKISEGIFKTIKVKSKNNVSNLFTKRLPIQVHKRFCDQLHLVEHFQA